MKTVIPFKRYTKQNIEVNSSWAIIDAIPAPPPECYCKITACFVADNSRDVTRDVLEIQYAIASSNMNPYAIGRGTLYAHSATKASSNSCTVSYIVFPEFVAGSYYYLLATSNSTGVLRVKTICTVEVYPDWQGWV